jgi:hypothetical protein
VVVHFDSYLHQLSYSYFTKDGQHGVCIFRRRKTVEEGHRGFRLSSLGILLAKSRRPRPWRHVKELKELVDKIYSSCETSGLLQPTGSQWEPAQAFFEERKVRRADLGGAGDWNGWSHELSEVRPLLEPHSLLLHVLIVFHRSRQKHPPLIRPSTSHIYFGFSAQPLSRCTNTS